MNIDQLLASKDRKFAVHVEAPASGPFIAVGAMEYEAPDFLLGPGLSYAIKFTDIGTHNKLYAFFADGNSIPGTGLIELGPPQPGDSVPPLHILGSITDDLFELVPTIYTKDGDELKGNWDFTPDLEFTSPAQAAYQASFVGETYGFRGRFIFRSMSPLPVIEGFLYRLDRQAEAEMSLRFEFGEEVVWVNVDPETSTSEITDSHSFEMTARVPMNGQVPLTITLAAVSLLTNTDNDDNTDDARIDIRKLEGDLGTLFTRAVENARDHGRQFYFKRVDWTSRFLGTDIDTSNNLARSSASFWNHRKLRPYDSADYPSQAGSQDSFGASFYAPIWSTYEADVLHDLLINAYAWMDRPSVVFHRNRPGFPIVPEELPAYAMTEHRQFHPERDFDPAVEFPGQNVPYMGAEDPISGRRTPNQTHLADMPLFAAYALTGHFALQCQIELQNAMDLRQKEVFLGWIGNSREEGRVIQTMLTAGRLRPNLWKANLAWCEKRIKNVMEKSYTQDPSTKMWGVRPIHWANLDGNANSPWENAQLAEGLFRLYIATGKIEYALWCHRVSRSIGYSAINRNGEIIVPYVYKVLDNHQDYYFPPEERWTKRDYYAFSETATNWSYWSAQGARAHINAAIVLYNSEYQSEVIEHLEATQWCLTIINWVDSVSPGNIADIHMSNWLPSRATPVSEE